MAFQKIGLGDIDDPGKSGEYCQSNMTKSLRFYGAGIKGKPSAKHIIRFSVSRCGWGPGCIFIGFSVCIIVGLRFSGRRHL